MIQIGLADQVCSIMSGLGIRKSITRAQGKHLWCMAEQYFPTGTWPEVTEMSGKAI